MLEPRRLAAKAAAMRMAEMLGERAGETVGYQVRFERRASAATRVEVTGASVTGDGAFIRRVYAELIQLGRDEDLLELPAGPLEAHLAERGKFATAQQGGALTRDQSRHLELLARLYARRDRHGLAAQVFFALAERTGSADSTVSLDERAALLDLATRHAKTPGNNTNSSDQTTESDVDPAFVEQIEGKIKVLGFQRRLHATFTERSRDGLSADADRYASKASELERELRPLSDMYNDFAFPCDMWDVCLEMLHFSQYRDADGGVARGLWDSLLAGEGAAATAAGGDDRAALSAACNAARALGPKLFPSDVAFPVAHVALKLELMAGGLWGGTRSAVSGSEEVGAVAEALLSATGDSPRLCTPPTTACSPPPRPGRSTGSCWCRLSSCRRPRCGSGCCGVRCGCFAGGTRRSARRRLATGEASTEWAAAEGSARSARLARTSGRRSGMCAWVTLGRRGDCCRCRPARRARLSPSRRSLTPSGRGSSVKRFGVSF